MDFVYVISALVMGRIVTYYYNIDEDSLPGFWVDIIIRILHIIVFSTITYTLLVHPTIWVRFFAIYAGIKTLNCIVTLWEDISDAFSSEDDETIDDNIDEE